MNEKEVRVIPKPWGEERWLAAPEDNCNYVLKMLILKAGFKTSLQYHHKKIETICILSGKGFLHYQDTLDGPVKNIPISAGTVFHVKPPAVHRVEAVEDLRYVEASTTEVEDLVRLEDSYGRKGTSHF